MRRSEGIPYAVWVAWVWNSTKTHKISMKVLAELYESNYSPEEAVKEYERRYGKLD